jgi:hypothetical protein
MRVKSLATLLIVIAILLIMAVTSEVFVNDVMHTNSLFGYLVVSVLIGGLVTTAIFEKMNTKILE